MKQTKGDGAPEVQQAPSKQEEARERGFAQSVHELRRTLCATPAGWMLVAWLAHGSVPYRDLLIWLGLFGIAWASNLLVLRGIERAGSSIGRHHFRLLAVSAIDGASWGMIVLLLMTHYRILDSWLVVVLCGVVSVNVPTYITYPPAFRALVGSMWLTATASAVFHFQVMQAAPQLVLGLLVYLGVLAYTVRPISNRVIEGIRLQLENAALADQLRETLTQMEHQATTDALTGQMNRRALDSALLRYIDEAKNRGRRFSILMLDVDHFKRINDTHGHGVGDQALRSVAHRVAAQLRAGDSCARYGGEEFVVLLPGASLVLACEIGERIRFELASEPLAIDPPLLATASIGVAEYRAGMSAEALLAAADGAVYVAKRSGRNQVRLAEDSPNGFGGHTESKARVGSIVRTAHDSASDRLPDHDGQTASPIGPVRPSVSRS